MDLTISRDQCQTEHRRGGLNGIKGGKGLGKEHLQDVISDNGMKPLRLDRCKHKCPRIRGGGGGDGLQIRKCDFSGTFFQQRYLSPCSA